MAKLIVLFLFLNFAALGIGGFFTGSGVPSDWYQDLNKAPWTPPGWVFGAAWTLIMITFAWYMTYLIRLTTKRQTIILLFAIQWVLNILWNPLFFYYQQPAMGLICISLLTLLVGYFLFKYIKNLGIKSLFIAPYFLWLIIATSLNAYILFYN